METAKREVHAQRLDGDVVDVLLNADGAEEARGGEQSVGGNADGEGQNFGVEVQGGGADCESGGCERDAGEENDASAEYSDYGDQNSPNDNHRWAKENGGNDKELDSYSDSWEDDEPPPLQLNYEALKHIATYFLPGSHGACIDISTLRRGTFHEARVLHFEDGWTCIGRFTREDEALHKTESELATIEYVRKHTTIPVPEIYFVNHNRNHVVGSAFVLMERMPGVQLCDIWDGLSLDHKVDVTGQVADIVGQLCLQRFSEVGSLKPNGTMGPLLNLASEQQPLGNEPITSTIEYFYAFLDEASEERPEAIRAYYPEVKDQIRCFLAENGGNPILESPFRLLHGDFDSQNIIVSQENGSLPPKITGVIDWDWSHTGLLYFLCEYPVYIQDIHWSPENYADNKVLRKHFVRTLAQRFPEESSERRHIRQCFREKSFALNSFKSIFMRAKCNDEKLEASMISEYLRIMRGGYEFDFERLPYSGRLDWEPDTDSEDEGQCSSESELESEVESD